MKRDNKRHSAGDSGNADSPGLGGEKGRVATGERHDSSPWWGGGKPIKLFSITAEQEELIAEAVYAFDDATQRFFRHVFASSVLLRTKSRRAEQVTREERLGFVPVSSRFIQKFFRNANWRSLEGAGLLDVLPYDQNAKISRRFRPRRELFDRFNEIATATLPRSAADANRHAKRGRINVATGSRTTKSVRTKYYDDNRNPYPEVILKGLKAMQPCPVNYDAVRDHVDSKYREYKDIGGSASDSSARSLERSRRKLYMRWIVDSNCAAAILEQRFEHVRGRVGVYRPAYKIVRTGRTAQLRGGLQSCSKAMKRAAYSDLHEYGYEVYNYDLVAAQLRLFAALMKEQDLPTDWINRYMEVQHARVHHAQSIGMEEEVWKRVTIAMIMGASVPDPDEMGSEGWGGGALKDALRKTVNLQMRNHGLDVRDENGALTPESIKVRRRLRDDLYGAFYRKTRAMRAEIERWHDYLLNAFMRGAQRNNVDRKLYVVNRAGIRRAVPEAVPTGQSRRKLLRELAAFMLQGAEAALIQSLASLGVEYDFKPVANEHDGLVTIGEVPPAAVQAAAIAVGLDPAAAELELKPF